MIYKLLIVDDQKEQLKKYVRLFERDFECFTATSGEAALEIFKAEAPHTILCDVKMPGGISGFELCQQVKSLSPQTVVVLVSSYNNTATRIKGYESRADEYLNKMTDDQEVYLKVRNLLYTKNNIPASFPEHDTSSSESPNSFEDDVKKILIDYYKTPQHLRADEKIDLEVISQQLHKSSRTIQRDFSREANSTFSDFHNKIRLNLAASWLINTDKSIKEIAEQLGFASPSIFSRSFRLIHGLTPSKYRHNYLDGEIIAFQNRQF